MHEKVFLITPRRPGRRAAGGIGPSDDDIANAADFFTYNYFLGSDTEECPECAIDAEHFDSNCPQCGGEREVMRENAEGRFDRWMFGGRFNGALDPYVSRNDTDGGLTKLDTCPSCEGSGDKVGSDGLLEVCKICLGQGMIPVQKTIRQLLPSR